MIIANRSLKLRQGERHVDVVVRIFAPQRDHDHWLCGYEIDWPGGTRKSAAHGIDSVQAIELALKLIGSEIYTSDYHKSKMLMWEKPGEGYGFPMTKNIKDLLEGDDVESF